MACDVIVDSCCDLTPQMRERFGFRSIPLTMRLGEREYVDDSSLDLPSFMVDMAACQEKVGSASPSPHLYQEAMSGAKDSFVVTLSSQLSGSFSSAMLAKTTSEEDGTRTHIFDSKSASAGETLLAIKIRELIAQGLSKESIVQAIDRFIARMKTYFVLENYDNLRKNGRLSKITEKLIRFLSIKLVMGADGKGNIALYAKTKGTRQMLSQLLSFIEKSGKETRDENIVISHCNNPDIANRLAEAVRERFHFKEIFVVPTGGLSSMYADDKGVIMAF